MNLIHVQLVLVMIYFRQEHCKCETVLTNAEAILPEPTIPQILTTGLLLSNGEYTTEAKPYAEICYSLCYSTVWHGAAGNGIIRSPLRRTDVLNGSWRDVVAPCTWHFGTRGRGFESPRARSTSELQGRVILGNLLPNATLPCSASCCDDSIPQAQKARNQEIRKASSSAALASSMPFLA
jgi:hypothetical protein